MSVWTTCAPLHSRPFERVCACLVPFLRAGWLGVTLSLSTCLPAPLDPVAISNRLREVASSLRQPIAFTSPCGCVYACEWAGVRPHLRAPMSWYGSMMAKWSRASALIIRSDASSVLLIYAQFISVAETNVAGQRFNPRSSRGKHISYQTCWTEKVHTRRKRSAKNNQ